MRNDLFLDSFFTVIETFIMNDSTCLVWTSYGARCTSDTEVIIHSYQEWGTDCVKKFDGMFAFGIWDKNRETFFLARDRLGIKPLVYYLDEDIFIFASEIKAILVHPGIDKTRDDTAIYDYLTYGYIPSPKTPYRKIRKLEAAHTFVFAGNVSHYSKYWDIDFVVIGFVVWKI